MGTPSTAIELLRKVFCNAVVDPKVPEVLADGSCDNPKGLLASLVVPFLLRLSSAAAEKKGF